ncbi:hypothetical protein BCR35DRAFT_303679 [Leucosporidium creatinivorum]|uniref:Ribosomal protein L9 domain-containing protein n=1 Tax=Leucosporidium creatinivorum TaxID=106004 RepID=A0A1Y2FHL9_9BASI|nr:hypothetical protein BCR35DRAFT_303679 [Leucosporidium creatinivorum]
MLLSSSRLLTRSSNCAACCQVVQRRSAHKLVEIELLSDVPSLGRRGERLPVSPGRARNQLIPQGLGLYVVAGRGVSPLRDMQRREEQQRARGVLGAVGASKVVDGIASSAEAAAAESLSHDSSLLTALQLLPQPLTFTRLTTATTNADLFGSVSASDVLTELKEFGIRVEEGNAAFGEKEGVEKGRVKSLGDFVFNVQLKALGEEFPIAVKVLKEETAAKE